MKNSFHFDIYFLSFLIQNEFALFTAPRFFANACMDGISSERLTQVSENIANSTSVNFIKLYSNVLQSMEKTCTHQVMVGIN